MCVEKVWEVEICKLHFCIDELMGRVRRDKIREWGTQGACTKIISRMEKVKAREEAAREVNEVGTESDISAAKADT